MTADRTPTNSDAPRVMFVCTANRCRSPFAEAIGTRLAGARPFVFASAGFLRSGFPVPPTGLIVAGERGLSLESHRSSRLDSTMLQGWDVVLTMARDHARELVADAPELWPRVFTVKQFRRTLQTTPPHRHIAIGPWIDVVAADRSRHDIVGDSTDDDIADPLTEPIAAWRTMADVLQDEIGTILDLIHPPR